MPELTFDPAAHIYRLDGVSIPCITDLVAPLGPEMDEPDGIFELTIEAARERGTLLHGYLAHRLNGGDSEDYELPDAYAGYADAVELLLAEHAFTPALIEHPLCGVYNELTYAGTPDYIGLFDGALAILDWKFVSTLAKSRVGAQLNGYSALAAASDVYPETMKAVQFLRDGTYRIYPVAADLTAFDLCVAVWKQKTKRHPRGRIE